MNNKYIVLDSCVIAKLIFDEEDSAKARQLVLNLSKNKNTIVVPSMFYYEIFTIAQKKKANLEKVNEEFIKEQLSALEVIHVDQELIVNTINLIKNATTAKSGFPSFYNSVYHAVAIKYDCEFITTDRKHYQKTKDFGHIQLLHDRPITTTSFS